MSDLHALADLCGSHFHEDWALNGKDPCGVVDKFVRDRPLLAEWLPGQIYEVLSDQPTEEQLRHLVHDKLGCDYLPAAHGWKYQEWLSAIADRVQQLLADRKARARNNYARVSELFGYFHEDWVDDYPGPWDVVDDFVEDQPELAAELPKEVDRLLAENPSEAQLKQLFWELRCCYYIEADGWTYRGWLIAVADRVKRATAA